MTNEELIMHAQMGDEKALEWLFKNNQGLVVSVVKKITGSYSEDLVSIGNLAFMKAYRRFDASKGIQFVSFVVRCIENELRYNFRSEKKLMNLVSLNQPIYTTIYGVDAFLIEDMLQDENEQPEDVVVNCEWLKRVIEDFCEDLNEREKCILKSRILMKERQIDVARKLGISQTQVSREEERVKEKLRVFIKFKDAL